jgi:PAS domain S-box-containing protein
LASSRARLLQIRDDLEARVAELQVEARRQATILDHVYDSIIVTDLEGRITYCNPGATTLFGYTAEELRGQTPALLYPEQDQAEFGRDVARILAGEDYVGHWKGLRKDGAVVWVDVRTTVMNDAAGAPWGLIGVARDVTANKRAQEELDREQQLAAIVSHDLKGPIGAVLTGAFALGRAGELNPVQQRLLERIRSSAQRAARLTDQLLDFTSVRVGKGIALARGRADFHRLVSDVVDEARMTHPSRRIELRTDGDGAGEWDADRVSEVVQNLVTNALRYSPPDTTVSVRTRCRGADVVLEVRNLGPAIPPAQICQLFEPLKQGEQGQLRGLGLGLFIVDRIVRAHGGTVTVESTEANGTIFNVSLPRS